MQVNPPDHDTTPSVSQLEAQAVNTPINEADMSGSPTVPTDQSEKQD
jgi:hypothetical protein